MARIYKSAAQRFEMVIESAIASGEYSGGIPMDELRRMADELDGHCVTYDRTDVYGETYIVFQFTDGSTIAFVP